MSDPTRKPKPPPFAVGTRVQYTGNRSVKIGDRDPQVLYDSPCTEWLTLIEPGIIVTIDEVRSGRQGTGRLVDLDDDGETFIDETTDGYSVYHVQGKHRRDGRVIDRKNAKEWKVLK